MQATFISLVACVVFGQTEIVGPTNVPATAAADEEKINGVPLSALEASLTNKEFRHQRLRAMEDIGWFAPKPTKFVPIVCEALKDSDPVVRSTAARSLGRIGKRLPSLVDEFLNSLQETLNDPQHEVRAQVALALGDLGPPARPLLLELRKHYADDKSPHVRECVLGALVNVTQGSDDQLETLILAVNQVDFRVQSEWLRDLAVVGRDSRDAVKAIQGCLTRQGDPQIFIHNYMRQQAAAALAGMGPIAKDAVGDLFIILREQLAYEDVYEAKAEDAAARQRVVVARQPTTFLLRMTAAAAITQINPFSQDALFDLLIHQLENDDPDLRLSVAIIVSRLAHLKAAQRASKAIQKHVDDDDPNVRVIARLAMLRLDDPDVQSDDNLRLTTFPLPADKRTPPDPDELKRLLIEKVNVSIKLTDGDDVEALFRHFMLPNQYEKALLQGDLRRQIVEKGRRMKQQFRQPLEIVKENEIQIDGRTAIAPTAADTKEPIRWYWFDGRWYLAGE